MPSHQPFTGVSCCVRPEPPVQDPPTHTDGGPTGALVAPGKWFWPLWTVGTLIFPPLPPLPPPPPPHLW